MTANFLTFTHRMYTRIFQASNSGGTENTLAHEIRRLRWHSLISSNKTAAEIALMTNANRRCVRSTVDRIADAG